VGGEAADRHAVQSDVAVRRPLEPDDDLEERALAGSVGTDDGDDLAVVDPERDAVDGREPAEPLCDRIDLEQQVRLLVTTGDTGSAAAT
jgi:hypothetical protein